MQTGKRWKPSRADLEYVFECASQGLPQKAILEGLNVDWHTFNKNLPFFSEAIKKGKEQFDKHTERQVPEVVNSLLKRCLGYEYDEVSIKQDGEVVNGKLLNGKITTTKTKKHVQASDAAIFFFLCNKDKLTWINPMKLDEPSADNRGSILKWIEEQAKEPAEKKDKKKK